MKIAFSTLDAINQQLTPEDLERRGVVQRANDGKSYVCLKCQNGTHTPKSSGIIPNYKNGAWLWHCFSCNAGFNNFKLLSLYYGLDTKKDFVALVEKICADFGIQIQYDGNYNFAPNNRPARPKQAAPKDTQAKHTAEEKLTDEKTQELKLIAEDIKSARLNLEKFMASYGEIRGLTFATLDYFNCGVIFNWTHPKSRLAGKKLPTSRRLIIPAGIHYNAVVFDEDRAKIEKKYWKMHAGKMIEPFGLKNITADTKLVFIYEGEIDAMSAFQSYHERIFLMDSMSIFDATQAVNIDNGKTLTNKPLANTAFLATFGAANTNWIDAFNAKCKQLNIKPRVIVMLDDDETGQKNAPNHRQKLINLGYSTVIKFLKRGEND